MVLKKKTNAVQIVSAKVAAQQRIFSAMKNRGVGFCAHIQLGGNLQVMSYLDPPEAKGLAPSQMDIVREYGI